MWKHGGLSLCAASPAWTNRTWIPGGLRLPACCVPGARRAAARPRPPARHQRPRPAGPRGPRSLAAVSAPAPWTRTCTPRAQQWAPLLGTRGGMPAGQEAAARCQAPQVLAPAREHASGGGSSTPRARGGAARRCPRVLRRLGPSTSLDRPSCGASTPGPPPRRPPARTRPAALAGLSGRRPLGARSRACRRSEVRAAAAG
mmetsp:Transcript_18953/g.60114  ORF Transcript_18953/g.60114 Transcript_18953/m.60114 type:complete len:201 (-) Transcript_18953:218-820(-)